MQVRDGSAPQTGNREYQPICSSKTFTTIVDQPLEKEVLPSGLLIMPITPAKCLPGSHATKP